MNGSEFSELEALFTGPRGIEARDPAPEGAASPTASSCSWRPMVDVLRSARARTPIPTGFPLLDSTFFSGGFSPGEAAAIGGPPGAGKTTFIAGLAANMAGPSTYLGFAAFDEPEEKVAAKIGSRFGEAFWRLNAEYPSVLESLEERLAIKDAEIFFVDPLAAPAVEDILETFAARVPPGRIGVLFNDHLHVMTTRDACERDTEFDTIRKVATAVARETRRLGIVTVSVAEVLKAASSPDAVRANPLGAFAGTRKIASLFTVPMVFVPAEAGSFEVIIAKNRLGPRGSAILSLNPETWALTVDSVRTSGSVGDAESRTATTAKADDDALRKFFAESEPVTWETASARLQGLGVPKGRSLDARRRLAASGELEQADAPRPAGSSRGPAPAFWSTPRKLQQLRQSPPEPLRGGVLLPSEETPPTAPPVKGAGGVSAEQKALSRSSYRPVDPGGVSPARNPR